MSVYLGLDGDDALRDSLMERLSGRPSIAQTLSIAHEAIDDAQVLNALLSLIYTAGDPLRWRVAWVLVKVTEMCPALLIDQRGALGALVIRHDVPYGVKRLLYGVLYNMPDADEIDVALLNDLLESMVCLQAPPGVQALAMKLAARMCGMDEGLWSEFCCIVRSMELEYYSPGVRASVRYCLKNKDKKKH